MSTKVKMQSASFAELIERIAADRALTPMDRKEMTGALRAVARVSGLPADTLPVDLAYIRAFFEETSSAKAGVSKGRWTNVKCHAIRALRYAGVKVLSGRCNIALPDPWAGLVFQVSEGERRVMLGFFRYCIERGLDPDDVTQDVFDEYAACVDAHSARSTRWQKLQATRRIWNRCRTTVTGWPELEVSIEDRRKRYAAPPESLPASLREEIEALVQSLGKEDLLSLNAKKPLRPATIARRRYTLYRLASAAVRSGVAPETLVSLRALVDDKVAQQGLRFLLQRPGKKSLEDVYKVAETIHAVARTHVGLEGEKLRNLRILRDNLRKQLPPKGMTTKNRALLRCFEDEDLVAAFLLLPEKLVSRFRKEKKKTRLAAARLANALALELLSVAPIRISNLAAIRLDEHLITHGNGRYLAIPRHEVKNSEALEFALPPSTAALLDLYLKEARPRLSRSPSPYLFPGRVDGHKQGADMSVQLANLTKEELGVRMTAHQFRHLAGFLYLRQNPGCYELVRQLLGHRSIQMTIDYYAGMERDAAIRIFDDFIEGSRQSVKGQRRTRRGA